MGYALCTAWFYMYLLSLILPEKKKHFVTHNSFPFTP